MAKADGVARGNVADTDPARRWFVPGLLLAALLALAQDASASMPLRGMPLTQHYDSNDYKSPSTLVGLAIDGQGRLHAATREGLTILDGTEWETLEFVASGGATAVA